MCDDDTTVGKQAIVWCRANHKHVCWCSEFCGIERRAECNKRMHTNCGDGLDRASDGWSLVLERRAEADDNSGLRRGLLPRRLPLLYPARLLKLGAHESKPGITSLRGEVEVFTDQDQKSVEATELIGNACDRRKSHLATSLVQLRHAAVEERHEQPIARPIA